MIKNSNTLECVYGALDFSFNYQCLYENGTLSIRISANQELQNYNIGYGLYLNARYLHSNRIDARANKLFAAFSIEVKGNYQICIGFRSTIRQNGGYDTAFLTENFSEETIMINSYNYSKILPILYQIQMMHSVGGSITQFCKDNDIRIVTLIGDDILVKAVATELFHKTTIGLKYLLSDVKIENDSFIKTTFTYRGTQYIQMTDDLPNDTGFVIICKTSQEEKKWREFFHYDNTLFASLSEILKIEYCKSAFYRPISNFIREHPSIPVIVLKIPGGWQVSNLGDIDKQSIKLTIADIRNSLNMQPPIVPMGLTRFNLTVKDAIDMVKNFQIITCSNGLQIIADISSKCVNVTNGQRLTVDHPEDYEHTIWTFGHSRTFGIGTDDRNTIQSHLQNLFNLHNANDKFRVVNYANSSGAEFNRVFSLINSLEYEKGDICVIFHYVAMELPFGDTLLKESGAFVCDCHEVFENTAKANEPIFVDTSHLNAEGNKIVADTLYQFIKKEAFPDNSKVIFNNQDILPSIPPPTPGLVQFKKSLAPLRLPIGSIVMNCNPFTFGHRYLIEYAISKVKHLYIFAVEEDKSIFPFRDRIELIKQGTADLANVTVLPSGRFIISSLTFSDYFNKADLQDSIIDPSQDVELFGKEIAPVLGITVRFAGEEPLDNITSQYNNAMNRILPKYGVEFVVIPRKEIDGEVISASRVRKLLESSDFDTIAKLVPKTTLEYLKTITPQQNLHIIYRDIPPQLL